MRIEHIHRRLIDQQGGRGALNTPVLILDLDALDRNIVAMAEFAERSGVSLRPHSKTHKCPDIARLQIRAGAVGQCCAKLGEAEALAEAGVNKGLLITSPVVSAPAIARLVELNAKTEGLMVVVDHPANARALQSAAEGSGRSLNVLIDIDPGLHRTGVTSPDASVDLWREIAGSAALSFRGVQFYCGAQQHIPDFETRRQAITELAEKARQVIAALKAAGAEVAMVTGGGTGTHRIDVELGLFTELQVGSYIFMDRQYAACELAGSGGASPFETALMIDARVISANTPGLVTIDAGLKAFATEDGAPPILSGAPEGAQYRFMGDEHGAVIYKDAQPAPELGDLVTLGAPHCDPTVNLYEAYHVVQRDVLRHIWPIAGRGRSQ